MMNMNRRQFIQVSGVLSLAPFLPGAAPSFATSSSTPPIGKFFAVLRVPGGMDVTLGLDPWTEAQMPLATDMFVEYRQDELIDINPAMKLGPSCAPMKAHAGDFSVVNGVFMSQADNGHGASLSYISAGSSAPTSPSLAVEVARSTMEGDFGVVSDGMLFLGDRTITSTTTTDLKDLPGRTDMSPILKQVLTPGSKTSFAEAIQKILSSSNGTQNFIKNLLSFGAAEDLGEGPILAAAFMSDVSSCAQLDLSVGLLDTHGNHVNTHKTEQTKVWDKVSEILTLFKKTPYGGGSLFDHTTFMVVSEFARTPALNGAGGKDHNPFTNSVMLAGRGIKGGLVVGASKLVTAVESPDKASYHIAYPIDFATCEVERTRTPESRMIFPENVAQTVATAMEVDRNIFRSFPAETLPLSVLLKS